MTNKWRKLVLTVMGGIVFSIALTSIMYRFFPQYLCYYVYDVSENNLYRTAEKEMFPGMFLTESFIPQYHYLTGIKIELGREDNDNMIIGRLLDGQGKIMAENRFTLRDMEYKFSFNKWVDPGQEYQLEIIFPEQNQGSVTVTFGSGDSGSEEHENSYINGTLSEDALYIRYIYGTYSRKLLAFWLIVLFLGGFMIGDTILYKLTEKHGKSNSSAMK